MCLICGFIYDEALGLPDEGIPPGTKWADIPLSWRCPDCAKTTPGSDPLHPTFLFRRRA
jgi:rubredoxin